jgi:hypothetical protein
MNSGLMKDLFVTIFTLLMAQLCIAQQDSLKLKTTQGSKGLIYFKTELIGKSDYENEDHPDLDMTGKGNLKMISGGFYIPVSTKINNYNRPTVWAVSSHIAHTTADNTGAAATYTPEKMLNVRFAVTNIRPLSKKWSMLTSLGGGVFTDQDQLSEIRADNLMAQGRVVFIRHLKPNLDLGGGLSVTTMLGYPFPLPEFYLRWTLQKYNLNVDFSEGARISAGVKLTNYMKLSVFGDMGGMMALTEKDDKKVMFTHTYTNVGLRPEFTFGKISVPISIGITPFRNSFYKERTLKKFFENKGEDYSYPHFKSAFYISTAITYQF